MSNDLMLEYMMYSFRDAFLPVQMYCRPHCGLEKETGRQTLSHSNRELIMLVCSLFQQISRSCNEVVIAEYLRYFIWIYVLKGLLRIPPPFE
jgi:hypothetical protein